VTARRARARKATRAELEERAARLSREADVLSSALRFVTLDATPDLDETSSVRIVTDRYRIRARAYRLDRADGGIVLITVRSPRGSSSPSVHAYYADDWSEQTLRRGHSCLDESAAFFRAFAQKIKNRYHDMVLEAAAEGVARAAGRAL
jgi:hypothetical protein